MLPSMRLLQFFFKSTSSSFVASVYKAIKAFSPVIGAVVAKDNTAFFNIFNENFGAMSSDPVRLNLTFASSMYIRLILTFTSHAPFHSWDAIMIKFVHMKSSLCNL